jgi:hypothetical protein
MQVKDMPACASLQSIKCSIACSTAQQCQCGPQAKQSTANTFAYEICMHCSLQVWAVTEC